MFGEQFYPTPKKIIEKVRCIEDVLGQKFTPGEWYEGTFFRAKGFKKCTLHIEFKDLELLKQFNYIVCKSKNWLPPETK